MTANLRGRLSPALMATASAAFALACAAAGATEPQTGWLQIAQAQPAAPAAPAAPPSWKQGQPAEMAASPLAPHAPGLTAKAPADIPLDKIKLPPGFQISLWASGLPNARSMTLGDKGTVFVGTRFPGKVYAVSDRGDRRDVQTIAEGLHRSNGVAFKDGALFVAELSRVHRFDAIESNLGGPPPKSVLIYEDLPKDEPHGWKFIAVGPDGMLYVPVGAPCNICEPPGTHAQIRRIKTDGSGAEVIARGVRNTVGFDWHPVTKELWFTDNGRDWMGEEGPADELNRVARAGQHFGYPFCHQGDMLDPEHGKGKSCADYVAPELNLGPHVAALGMRFYTGDMFPAAYKNRIIVALHGSWNRTVKSGFNVMQVTLNPNQPPKYEVFAEGWLQGDQFWGRPADVLVLRDGSLLISDDVAGAIYRVTYKG